MMKNKYFLSFRLKTNELNETKIYIYSISQQTKISVKKIKILKNWIKSTENTTEKFSLMTKKKIVFEKFHKKLNFIPESEKQSPLT